MGFCGLHPEFEKARGNHVVNLEKAGCTGCSFPNSGEVLEEKPLGRKADKEG